LKLIAHRGWAAGAGENTLAAFRRAAADGRISGVEFDVRRDPASERLLVSHDPPQAGVATLALDEALGFLAGTRLELLAEVKEPGIAPAVIDALVEAGVAERSVVFGFADVARTFPWAAPRPVRLGAILVHPWTMGRFIAAHRPDVISLGWDGRAWTRLAFRAWWLPLGSPAQRYGRPAIVGIVRRKKDLDWLARRNVHAAVADMDAIVDALPPPS